MWSTLKAAFWHRERLPLLGNVPVNVLLAAAFGALGFGSPVFWWIGTGLEAAWLFLCATSPRYRRVASLPEQEAASLDAARKQEAMLQSLEPRHRQRHESLRTRISQIAGLWRGDSEGTAGTGLDQLEWFHLKFLLAKQHLEITEAEAPHASIASQLEDLKTRMAQPGLAPSIRASHEATLRIVEERLATSVERTGRLEEIEASLHRIEQQLELTREQAIIRSNSTAQAYSVDLAASNLSVSSELFGSNLTAVGDLDRWHAAGAIAE